MLTFVSSNKYFICFFFFEVPEFSEKYMSIQQGVVKADYSRFLYMYIYGGFYSDLDMTPLRPHYDLIEEFKDFKIILPNDPFHGINFEWGFSLVKKHPWFYKCLVIFFFRIHDMYGEKKTKEILSILLEDGEYMAFFTLKTVISQ
jgi:mannosyltransferase OCH1-like enzyme